MKIKDQTAKSLFSTINPEKFTNFKGALNRRIILYLNYGNKRQKQAEYFQGPLNQMKLCTHQTIVWNAEIFCRTPGSFAHIAGQKNQTSWQPAFRLLNQLEGHHVAAATKIAPRKNSNPNAVVNSSVRISIAKNARYLILTGSWKNGKHAKSLTT